MSIEDTGDKDETCVKFRDRTVAVFQKCKTVIRYELGGVWWFKIVCGDGLENHIRSEDVTAIGVGSAVLKQL